MTLIDTYDWRDTTDEEHEESSLATGLVTKSESPAIQTAQLAPEISPSGAENTHEVNATSESSEMGAHDTTAAEDSEAVTSQQSAESEAQAQAESEERFEDLVPPTGEDPFAELLSDPSRLDLPEDYPPDYDPYED